ncbi:hypothetical protein G4G28_23185 [Massilia sp. Dwa41.01b]|nr:hypothetical protein [Massilia sp. Dwa41.01b]QNA90689.1 hypothetical protein G4G28_23185 [Massilia sp. Dwa41.01b]
MLAARDLQLDVVRRAVVQQLHGPALDLAAIDQQRVGFPRHAPRCPVVPP